MILQAKNRSSGSQKGKCENSRERQNVSSECIGKYNRPCLRLFPEHYDAMPIAQRRRMMDEGEMMTFDVLPCHAPCGGEELLDTMVAAQQRNALRRSSVVQTLMRGRRKSELDRADIICAA